jgi:hypothetical protein
MVARLTAAAVMLFMAGAPVLTTVCETICAARTNEPGTSREHHSCHPETSPANETAVSPAAHLCGHSDDSPSAVAQSLSLLAAPAISVVAFELAPPTVEVAPAAVAPGHGPPLLSFRAAPLRI